jgi:C-terminal region of Mon2 protein
VANTDNVDLAQATHLFRDISDFLYHRCDGTSIDTFVEELESRRPSDDFKVLDIVEEHAQKESFPALWLHSLRRAADLASDDRDDVRNGAIRTVLTMFSAKGEEMSPITWQLSLKVIWLRMIVADEMSYDSLLEQDTLPADTSSVVKSKIETSGIVLGGISKLLVENLGRIRKTPQFPSIWSALITSLRNYLALELTDLNAEVYTALSSMLTAFRDSDEICEDSLRLASLLWMNEFPKAKHLSTASSKQKAFEAYISLFRQLHRLDPNLGSPQSIRLVVNSFYRCVTESEGSAYSSDVDTLTTLQKQIVGCLEIIQTEKTGIAPAIAGLLGRFIALPTGSRPQPGKLSFVALAKASMQILAMLVKEHIEEEGLLDENILLFALTSLEKPVRAKYSWELQGKPPMLWRKATSTAIALLRTVVPRLAQPNINTQTHNKYWDVIVQISEDIAHAALEDRDPDSDPSLYEDEDFDVESLQALRDIIIPSLGLFPIPDTTCRTYARAVFNNSLIHPLEADEIPDLASAPLRDIYKVRFGRTFNPRPTHRTEMAYTCLNELISLVSSHDVSAERVKLAHAAAPYLILRAALPIKAYIADQPLRGRLPQPRPERHELLFILKSMKEMESEPRAIPDAQFAQSRHRKHLFRLAPLLSRAVGVAVGDDEVLGELRGCLEALTEEFGL